MIMIGVLEGVLHQIVEIAILIFEFIGVGIIIFLDCRGFIYI